MPTATTRLTETTKVDGDDVESGIGQCRADMVIAAGVLGDAVQQQYRSLRRPGRLLTPAQLNQPISRCPVIYYSRQL